MVEHHSDSKCKHFQKGECSLEYEREIQKLRRRIAELEVLVTTDSLTGLPNKRFYEESIKRSVSYARRKNVSLCLAILDIDHFKCINDQYGHGVGDVVLETFGSLCADVSRDCDIVARIGGEEFAIIFKDTSLEEARQIAERLRKHIQHNLKISNKETIIKVTVSIGVAEMDGIETEQALFDRADNALYEAKKHGRNRVVCASKK